MQNNTWRFDFLTSDLRTASYERREYHRMWLTWWVGQREEAFHKAIGKNINVIENFSIRKELGLTEALSEYTISPYSSTIELRMSKESPDKTVLEDLERDLLEIYSRIKFHNTKMNEYNSWYNLLGSKPEVCCRSLDYDDYVFFFGEPFEYSGSV